MNEDRRKRLINRRDAFFQLHDMNSSAQEFARKSWSQMSWDERLVKLWIITTFQPFEVLYEREVWRQMRIWFGLSTIAAVIALVLISTGSIVLLTGSTTVGLLTAVSSIVPSTVSTMFYAQYKRASERADTLLQLKLDTKRQQITLGHEFDDEEE